MHTFLLYVYQIVRDMCMSKSILDIPTHEYDEIDTMFKLYCFTFLIFSNAYQSCNVEDNLSIKYI